MLADKDADEFWNTFEVNVKGVYNLWLMTCSAAIPHLQKTTGRIITVGSNAGQLRLPLCSDYCTSKFAIQRFIEFVAIEYPDIKSFVLHPGVIPTTDMVKKNYRPGDLAQLLETLTVDTIALPAASILYFSAGKADWLNGR